jgi:hypothetical protein
MEWLLVLGFIFGVPYYAYLLLQANRRLRQELAQNHYAEQIEFDDYDFEELEELEGSPILLKKLNKVLEQKKRLLELKQAIVCDIPWTVNNSKKQGERMTQQQIRLMLMAFNGEADAIIEGVSWKNYKQSQEKMMRLFENLNKLGKPNACRVTQDYLKLRLEELALVFKHREAVAKEREEQREIREQMREEDKARRDLERAQIEAEKEAERFTKALEKARKDVEKAHGERQQQLLLEIARLEAALAQAENQRQRAIAQAQLTKSGYVYVISNVGAFGEGVYKIGMTRRLDPQDRIDELGDASVPFPFDVHAMIYTQDAPGLETALHKTFAENRINLVNLKKEFFRVELEQVAKAAKQHNADVRFSMAAEAEQFRRSQSVRAIPEIDLDF